MVMSARRLLFLSMLLIGAGLLTRLYYSKKFQANLSSQIQQNILREFQSIDVEARQLLKDRLSVSAPMWDEAKHFFIRVDNDRIVAWNRTYAVPDLTIDSDDDSVSFVSSSRGDFLLRKWRSDGESVLFCVLKLTDRFPIINNFLSSQWEPSIFPIRNIQIIAPGKDTGEEIKVFGKVLFRIVPQRSDAHESTVSFLLLIAGTLALFVAWWSLVRWVGKSYGYDAAFGVLFLGLLGIRLGMIAIGLPAVYWPTDIFDPKKFAS